MKGLQRLVLNGRMSMLDRSRLASKNYLARFNNFTCIKCFCTTPNHNSTTINTGTSTNKATASLPISHSDPISTLNTKYISKINSVSTSHDCIHPQTPSVAAETLSTNHPDATDNAASELSKGKLLIGFTCTKCHNRTLRTMSKQAYLHGIVIIECPGCKSRHLIADNLGWFKHARDPLPSEPSVAANPETTTASPITPPSDQGDWKRIEELMMSKGVYVATWLESKDGAEKLFEWIPPPS